MSKGWEISSWKRKRKLKISKVVATQQAVAVATKMFVVAMDELIELADTHIYLKECSSECVLVNVCNFG